MIRNYHDFVAALLEAGFSGPVFGKDEGVFSLFGYGWGFDEGSGIEWHTNCPDTDPWLWRLRVFEERSDIAYGKIFFRKAGFITKEWYPYFYTARRRHIDFDEEYESGAISHFAKRLYYAVLENPNILPNQLKRAAGFTREEKPRFDSALTDLQMRMYITISGVKRNISREGKEYGWTTTVFDTPERFFGDAVMENAKKMTAEEAVERISERILQLNPAANRKKMGKFISG